MRRLLFLLVFLLAACGGNSFDPTPAPVQHKPSISSLTLSPDTASHMDGGGQVAITAEITVRDIGLDIQALLIRMPDGITHRFDEQVDTVTGTLTEEFMISTDEVGMIAVEFWLEDRAGSISLHHHAEFDVGYVDFDAGWTRRLAGLPFALYDVIWTGNVFVAVGGGGTVVTSVDGIDWIPRDAGTDMDLFDVASFGNEIFVAGDGLLLLSTDGGESWVTKATPDLFNLQALAGNASRLIVGGTIIGPDAFDLPGFLVSEDRGETWDKVNAAGDPFYRIKDLIYRDGLFVATTEKISFDIGGDALVQVSADGLTWHEYVVLEEGRGLRKIIHDGSKFIAAGVLGAVFTSFDAYNWTAIRLQPDGPIGDVVYLSATSDGTTLLVAGGHWDSCALLPCNPESDVPIGIASNDDGSHWNFFNIDGRFKSHGMAFGNGRFVSVGESGPDSGEGAIYTVD